MSTIAYPDVCVSVAIPTWNGSRRIVRTIQALKAGSRVPDDIIVMDQSENDLTKIEVRKLQREETGDRIKWAFCPRRGASANRNDAFKLATGEFIAFVDDDISVDRLWLELMLHEWVAVYKRSPVVVTGRILPGAEFGINARVPAIRTSLVRRVYHDERRIGEVLYSAHFGASRALLARLGPNLFDERLGTGTKFPGGEDDDFAYRVLKAGYPIVYEPSIYVMHHPQPRSWRRTRYNYGLGSGAFMAKHVLSGDVGIVKDLFRNCAGNIWKGLRSLARWEEPEGSARLIASAAMVIGFIRWMFLVSRRQSTCQY